MSRFAETKPRLIGNAKKLNGCGGSASTNNNGEILERIFKTPAQTRRQGEIDAESKSYRRICVDGSVDGTSI
jgi:hypothetical protein